MKNVKLLGCVSGHCDGIVKLRITKYEVTHIRYANEIIP
jgi:hypothetical protein